MLKKTIVLVLSVLFVTACLSSCSDAHSEYYDKYLPYKHYFGSRIYSTIDYQCSKEERAEVSDIMATAEKVFTYVGTQADSDKDVGELSKYYRFTDDYSISSVELKLDLITAKTSRNSGYMWIVYTVDRYDSDKNYVNGSGDVVCYWKIEKADNKWLVADVIEPA